MASFNVFAYGGSYYETPGWLYFFGFLLLIWGVLEIILFFKIWEMTKDVKALKKDYFNETVFDSKDDMAKYLRKNLVLGNIGNVKRILFNTFFDEVENSYNRLPLNIKNPDPKSDNMWIAIPKEENLKKSIRPYVEQLTKQFDIIGENIPEYIKNMNTYDDFFKLFVKEDLIVHDENKIENPNDNIPRIMH